MIFSVLSLTFLCCRSLHSDSGEAADIIEGHQNPSTSHPSSPCSVQSRIPKSPVIGNSSSQNPPSSPLKESRQNSLLRLRLPLVNSNSGENSPDPTSPSAVRDVKDKILAGSKSILGKVLSPSKEKNNSREKVDYLGQSIIKCCNTCILSDSFTYF